MTKTIQKAVESLYGENNHNVVNKYDVIELVTTLLNEQLETVAKEAEENHYCCKFMTPDKKDFCDHCLSRLTSPHGVESR